MNAGRILLSVPFKQRWPACEWASSESLVLSTTRVQRTRATPNRAQRPQPAVRSSQARRISHFFDAAPRGLWAEHPAL
jgi:hypothetical protein